MPREQRWRHRGRGRPSRRGPLGGSCSGLVLGVGRGRREQGKGDHRAPDAVHTTPIREDRDRGVADLDTGGWGHIFIFHDLCGTHKVNVAGGECKSSMAPPPDQES